jgi:hypothetical protein
MTWPPVFAGSFHRLDGGLKQQMFVSQGQAAQQVR